MLNRKLAGEQLNRVQLEVDVHLHEALNKLHLGGPIRCTVIESKLWQL
jgi:hypothetical protein